MAPRPCLDCGTPTPGSRCPTCQARKTMARGTRQQRGLGRDHELMRAALLSTARVCALCGLPPTATDPLTAGHKVARANGGTNEASNYQAEHASCNYSKGAK